MCSSESCSKPDEFYDYFYDDDETNSFHLTLCNVSNDFSEFYTRKQSSSLVRNINEKNHREERGGFFLFSNRTKCLFVCAKSNFFMLQWD